MIELQDNEIRELVNPPPASEAAINEARWAADLVETDRVAT